MDDVPTLFLWDNIVPAGCGGGGTFAAVALEGHPDGHLGTPRGVIDVVRAK